MYHDTHPWFTFHVSIVCSQHQYSVTTVLLNHGCSPSLTMPVHKLTFILGKLAQEIWKLGHMADLEQPLEALHRMPCRGLRMLHP